MWPFGERLRDQDALEKYRRWLRRWLLDGDGGGKRKTAPGKQLATGGDFYVCNLLGRINVCWVGKRLWIEYNPGPFIFIQ